MFELGLLLVLASYIGCWIVVLIRDALRDRNRFYQHDWVAERRRGVDRRAFK